MLGISFEPNEEYLVFTLNKADFYTDIFIHVCAYYWQGVVVGGKEESYQLLGNLLFLLLMMVV